MNYLFLTSFGETANFIFYILLAILILLVMITVHEFGHYITGKIFGFGIEEFSIGFGPKLFSKKKQNGEVFSIRAVPLGGFCSFTGEDADSDDPKAFNNKKPWQRILVLISGAFMNYLTALIVVCLLFGIYGHTAIMTYDVKEENKNLEYCLQDRDVILKVEGKTVYLVTDLISLLDGRDEGEEISVDIIRQGKRQNAIIKLQCDTNFQNVEDLEKLCKSLGVEYKTLDDGALDIGFRSTGIRFGFFENLASSFRYTFKLASTVFVILGELFSGALGIGSLGGTVTTISVTANAIKTGGMWSLLNIAGFIGVNLAVFNLLPFPALDGSRVVFTAIEWIRKKPINRRVEGLIHGIGFVLILLFAIFIDLQQCF